MIVAKAQVRSVDIIDLITGPESYTTRGILEVFGLQTRTHNIGNVSHLIALLENSAYLHAIVVFCCHGDQDGCFIPELAPALEIDMPYYKKLTAKDFATILHLKDQVVINTGCCLGREEFAQSFLSRGAKAYIGTTDYIEGNAILPFITLFFYLYICKNMSLEKAFGMAQDIDMETNMFKLWQNKN